MPEDINKSHAPESPKFNQRVYDVSLDTLLTANVPRKIAEAASKVVASDDTTQPNNGRTTQDQQVVNTAMEYYWREQNVHQQSSP